MEGNPPGMAVDFQHLLKQHTYSNGPEQIPSCSPPVSLPAHDSSTLARFVSHPSQGVTTGDVCVCVSSQVYRTGRNTIMSPASVGSQHLMSKRHKTDADLVLGTQDRCRSTVCFAAHRLSWTLTRLQKRSVQMEQNLPLELFQVRQ